MNKSSPDVSELISTSEAIDDPVVTDGSISSACTKSPGPREGEGDMEISEPSLSLLFSARLYFWMCSSRVYLRTYTFIKHSWHGQ